MAGIQGNHSPIYNASHKHFGWNHFRDLSHDSDTDNEYNCDCVLSDLESNIKKFSKNESEKSHVPSEKHHGGDKRIRGKFSRGKIRDPNTKKLEQLSPKKHYHSTCDEPRRVKKCYKTTDTTHYSPNKMQVKSVEVIKSWSSERCKAKFSDEKMSKRKKLKKKARRHPKSQIDTKCSNTSISSALSSPNSKKYMKPRTKISSHNEISKNDHKNPLKVATEKSKEKNCPCCDSLMEVVKPSRVPTYPKSNRRREVSRERIYKRKESPRLLEKEFVKKLEMVQKARGESQMESWSRGSQCKTQKLCRMLKTREARRFMGCRCIESDDKMTPFVNCQCPECPYDLNDIDDSLNTVKEMHQENTRKIILNSEVCSSELDSSNMCTCEQPQFEKKYYNTKLCGENYDKIKPTNFLHEFSQQYHEPTETSCKKHQNATTHLREINCGMKKIEKPRKTITKCVTQQVEDNLQAQCSNNAMSPGNKRDASTIATSRKPTISRFVQYDTQFISSNGGSNKSNDDQDPVEAVASLCEKLIMINREIKSQCSCKSPNIPSHSDQSSIHTKLKKKNTSNHDVQYLRKQKSKSRTERHRFAFPKIVKGESNTENSDVPKMFVYSADDEDGTPLSLHKTGSFIKCAIERNNIIGNKYYVAYIQKYVSPAWKSDDNCETEMKSTEYMSSDDYG